MYKSVIFIEAPGGSDKGPDGHRRDTMPMVEALRAQGWNAETIFYTDDKRDEIHDHILNGFDAYVPRVNPGSIPSGEQIFFDMLRSLSDKGVVGMPHPDAMIGYGAKDALVRLTDTDLVPDDTFSYYDLAEFKESFAVSLSRGERVLKQNRGSTGEGIWRVVVVDERPYQPGDSLPLDTAIKCTEAVDNHVEMHTLGDFMDFCNQYLVGDGGMLLDMPFMPRITEGEIRILLVGPTPVFVVHKKPAESEDAFSATLFSGAKYRYDDPTEWPELIELFDDSIGMMMEKLGGWDIPLLWTADFMLDDGDDGEDKYVLGEINCSCVGFTSHLDRGIQDTVANQVIGVIES
ncbi:MAG: Cj0069 family protein, partial [Actinomycetota bacterium]